MANLGATVIKSGHAIVWKVVTVEVAGLKYGECTTNLLYLALL